MRNRWISHAAAIFVGVSMAKDMPWLFAYCAFVMFIYATE